MNYVGRRKVSKSTLKRTIVKKSNASIEDIMKAILDTHNKGLSQTKDFAKNFDLTKKSGFRKLWKEIKTSIRYVADKPSFEIVKSPAALYAIGEGDCKSFTIASGTTMINAGIEVYYDLVHYGDPNMAHIYPVAFLNGEEIIMDSVHDYFDERASGEKWHMRYDPITGNVVSQGKVSGIETKNKWLTAATAVGGIVLLNQKNSFSKLAGVGLLVWSGQKIFFST